MQIESSVTFVSFLLSLASLAQNAGFKCRDGRIIPAHQFCDGYQDCCDGSDEIAASSSSNRIQFNCLQSKTNLRCLLHIDYFCNGTIQCANANECDVGCPSYYKCQDKSCVKRTTVCDGSACSGCEEDDEWKTGIGFKCIKNGVTCRLPQQLVWDNVQDCDDGSDLCYKLNLTYTDGRDLRKMASAMFDIKTCFMCLDGSMIVPRSKLCDGIIDCSDLSDECLCPTQQPLICNKILLRTNLSIKICSNSSVCSTNATALCQAGQVVCGDGDVCVNRSSVCDGTADCRSHVDEGESYCRGTLPCASGLPHEATRQCRCSNFECVKTTGILCDGHANCDMPGSNDGFGTYTWEIPPGYPADECDARCPPTPGFNCTNNWYSAIGPGLSLIPCRQFHYLRNGTGVVIQDQIEHRYVCDGILDCPVDYADEKKCPKRFTCKSGDKVNIPIENVCDGRVDCDLGWDEKKTICPDRFFCSSLQGKKVSVSMELVCDFNINCDDGEDERNCSTTERFYCENGNPLFISKNKIFDGRGDCSDWSDECPTNNQIKSENVLASRYQLIGNPFLRALVWIMGLLAIAGNLVVIVGECIQLKTIFERNDAATFRTNHMLVLNLAISDLLMGVYLIMLGIAGAVYSGFYCTKSLEWLTSQTCVAMGVLVALSSETSMITMVLLTMSRLYAVFNPLSSNKPSTQAVLLLILLSWTISLTIALIPLGATNHGTFVEKAWILDNPFFGEVVHFNDAKAYAQKMLTYSPKLSNASQPVVEQVLKISSWLEVENVFTTTKSGLEAINVYRYFGYYSANSVCIPNIFATLPNRAWQFSLSITIFNFLSFCFVATGYAIIVVKALGGNGGKSRQAAKKNAKLQAKILRLIITDFFCWFPLSIMVFVNFSGVQINSISYAVAAIVLLPINSALNPILYSNFIDNIWQKVKPTGEPSTPSTSGQGTRSTNAHANTKM